MKLNYLCFQLFIFNLLENDKECQTVLFYKVCCRCHLDKDGCSKRQNNIVKNEPFCTNEKLSCKNWQASLDRINEKLLKAPSDFVFGGQKCSRSSCPDENGRSRCWTPAKDGCQIRTRTNCPSYCTDGGNVSPFWPKGYKTRCAPDPDFPNDNSKKRCCYEECAGGCHFSKHFKTKNIAQTCQACQDFRDGVNAVAISFGN